VGRRQSLATPSAFDHLVRSVAHRDARRVGPRTPARHRRSTHADRRELCRVGSVRGPASLLCALPTSSPAFTIPMARRTFFSAQRAELALTRSYHPWTHLRHRHALRGVGAVHAPTRLRAWSYLVTIRFGSSRKIQERHRSATSDCRGRTFHHVTTRRARIVVHCYNVAPISDAEIGQGSAALRFGLR